MLELMQWVGLELDPRTLMGKIPNLSNSLFLCWALLSLVTKRSAFLIAFTVAEIYGHLALFDFLDNTQFYLGYCFIYCVLYHHIKENGYNNKLIKGAILMVLFELVTALDAELYPKTITYISRNYSGFILLIHVYCMLACFRRKTLRSIMGASTNCISSIFRTQYNIKLLCYTIIK